MIAHVSFSPLLPWPVVVALAVLTLLPCLLALATRRRGGLLRLAGFALLVLILAGPRWVEHSARPLPDVALVLVDQSPSMDIGARHDMAARALAALRASAGRTDATRLIVAGIPPATSGGTQILPALHQALANIEPDQLAGIIAITDGEITDAAGLPRDAPFSALLTASGEETDRELRLDNAPSFGLAGQTVPLRLTVFDHGVNDAGAIVPVTVTEDGQTVATVAAVVGQPVSLNLPVRHAGPAVISAAAAPLTGAVSAINDQAAFTLTGIHKRLNVLLVSGSPNQGERAWRLLLKSDPAVQLVHFTILRMPGEPLDADPRDIALVPFPVRELFETDITKFDLIILDQFNANDLLPAEYLANIAAYVENGGALLAEVGPEFAGPESLAGSPLGPILPSIPAAPGTVTQDFFPLITPLGARHPVTASFAGAKLAPWERLEAATPTPGSLVLVTGADNFPLLVLGRAGKGRTGLLLSDQLWLWTRGGAHAGPALPLLRDLVHWFLHEPALEPEALTATIAHDRLSIDRRTLNPSYPGDATITDPDGQSRTVPLTQTAPGRYTATLPLKKNTGVWKISEDGQTAYAVAAPDNAAEYQDLAATASKLRGVAHNIVWLGRDPAPALGPLLTHRHATQITGTASQPLLPPVPALLIALALITAAWWRENGAAA